MLAEQERVVAEATRYANGTVPDSHPSRRAVQGSPADLRGIPVVGRGIPGALRGSRPDSGLARLDKWLGIREPADPAGTH